MLTAIRVHGLARNRWGLRTHGRPRVEKCGLVGGIVLEHFLDRSTKREKNPRQRPTAGRPFPRERHARGAVHNVAPRTLPETGSRKTADLAIPAAKFLIWASDRWLLTNEIHPVHTPKGETFYSHKVQYPKRPRPSQATATVQEGRLRAFPVRKGFSNELLAASTHGSQNFVAFATILWHFWVKSAVLSPNFSRFAVLQAVISCS